jgi:hypothetical protein
MAIQTLLNPTTAAASGLQFQTDTAGSVGIFAVGLAGAETVTVEIDGGSAPVVFVEAGSQVTLTATQPFASLPLGPVYRLSKSETAGEVSVHACLSAIIATFEAASAGGTLTDAIIVIGVGQSLMSSRGTNVLASSWSEAYMPVDGCAIIDFTFSAANVTHTSNWASLASGVALDEGATQSPMVGIATTIAEGPYARGYFCTGAIGSRRWDTLNQGGPRATMDSLVLRLCALAVAEGYTPKPVFFVAEGEANAAAGTSLATFVAEGIAYAQMLQMMARWHLGDPSYTAPVIFTYPAQQTEGEDDRNIKEGIRQIVAAVPGALDAGPIYQWPLDSDNVHPTPDSYVLRGEFLGRFSLNPVASVQIVSVVLDGDEFVATFNTAVVRDATLGVGADLAGTDGFEWLDNGTPIAITGLVYAGTAVTGTLATTPVGTIGQQVLRIAEQDSLAGSGADPADVSGSYVRADEAGWVSTFDPTYTNYRWAIPQRCSAADGVQVEAA